MLQWKISFSRCETYFIWHLPYPLLLRPGRPGPSSLCSFNCKYCNLVWMKTVQKALSFPFCRRINIRIRSKCSVISLYRLFCAHIFGNKCNLSLFSGDRFFSLYFLFLRLFLLEQVHRCLCIKAT